MTNKLQDDTQCIATWRTFISRFNKAIEGNLEPKKVEKELIALREESKLKNALNYHQTNSIMARCNNYLSGNWGKESYKPNTYDQQRSGTKK